MAARHSTIITPDTFFPGVLWWECRDCDASGGAYASLDEADHDRREHEEAVHLTAPVATEGVTSFAMSRG